MQREIKLRISELTPMQKSHLVWRLDNRTGCGLLTATAVARGDHGDLELVDVFIQYGGLPSRSARIHAGKVARSSESIKQIPGDDGKIEFERNATLKRRLGLEAMYAMKASAYNTGVENGREMVLDCFLMIGDYSSPEWLRDEALFSDVLSERGRIAYQADAVGGHLVEFLESIGIGWKSELA